MKKEFFSMHNPPHPGSILKELYLEPLNISVTEAAAGLHVTRKTLSTIINEKAGISPEMAIKLSVAFGTTPEHWLTLQQEYNLWTTKKNMDLKNIKHFFSNVAPFTNNSS